MNQPIDIQQALEQQADQASMMNTLHGMVQQLGDQASQSRHVLDSVAKQLVVASGQLIEWQHQDLIDPRHMQQLHDDLIILQDLLNSWPADSRVVADWSHQQIDPTGR